MSEIEWLREQVLMKRLEAALSTVAGIEEGGELLRGWYLGQVEESKEYIRLDKEWISALNGFREKYPSNWKIVEASRELIFYHTRQIQEEVREIAGLRETINQLG